MDIGKQIKFMLFLLGVVLLLPPTLRYFDIDVKTVYRKMLALEEPSTVARRDGLLPQKKEISQEVFNELFNQTDSVTAEQGATIKQEFEHMISGMERVAGIDTAPHALEEERQIEGVPSMFRYNVNAQHKVRWLPPPPGFKTAETFNYLIYRQQQPVGEKLKTVLDDIHGNLMLDLTPFTLVAKPNKILVMLFEDRNSYMDFTKRPAWSGAASDLQADTMYVLEGPNFYPLSVHELTHLYFDGYFLPSISPLWLSEGMAVYMQIYASHKKPNWIDAGLRSILSGKYINLQSMMDMEDLSSLTTEQAELWYTQAFSLVDYLLNSHSRDEFYRFCNELKGGAEIYQALYRAYGMPFNKVSVLQNVWLYDLERKVGRQLFAGTNRQQNVQAEVLSSTQTVTVPVQQPNRDTSNTSTKTVIPKLKTVDTNGYKGYF